ncbi:hypothetical protein JS562_53575, partial [Agrobacterium sp. S2]|nr:hypothetical protein [Agrobacterium sp. S2]
LTFRLNACGGEPRTGRITAFSHRHASHHRTGVAAGAVFAFAASFDEVVMVLFVAGPQQRTLPKQMFTGLREQLDPTIIAAAVLMIVLTALLMLVTRRLNKR